MLREAQDPGTTPERLRALSRFFRLRGVLVRVASNPNTPSLQLQSFGQICPRAFLENPVLPLLILEDPGFLRGLRFEVVLALLSEPGCPLEYLEQWATHPNLMVQGVLAADPKTPASVLWKLSEGNAVVAVAKNPNAPAALLIALAEGAHFMTRSQAALHPSMPRERLRLLQLASGSLTLSNPSGALPNVDAEALRSLAAGGVYACWLAARHPSTPAEVLARLAQHTNEQVRIFLAGNPALAPALAARLASDEEQSVRAQVAQHSALPFESMKLLSRDESTIVRAKLAENKRLPASLLWSLAHDAELEVCAAALRNGGVTPNILASPRLLNAPEPSLRLLLCEHPRVPAETLRLLLQDPELRVRQAAKAKEKLLRARTKKNS